MKNKLIRFMMGRYGGRDTLNKALTWTYFILLFLSIFTGLEAFAWIAVALAAYSLFRVLSRNIAARQRENALFCRPFRERKDKEHAYRTCPHCKSRLRLPRKKGKHTVGCPRCGKDFEVKI